MGKPLSGTRGSVIFQRKQKLSYYGALKNFCLVIKLSALCWWQVWHFGWVFLKLVFARIYHFLKINPIYHSQKKAWYGQIKYLRLLCCRIGEEQSLRLFKINLLSVAILSSSCNTSSSHYSADSLLTSSRLTTDEMVYFQVRVVVSVPTACTIAFVRQRPSEAKGSSLLALLQ